MIPLAAYFAALWQYFANGNWVDPNDPMKVIVDCGTLEFEDGEQDNLQGWSMKSA